MAKVSFRQIAAGFIVTVAVLAGEILSASAETVSLNANLAAAATVPSNSSAGTGSGKFTYNTDTKQLKYTIVFKNLTGAATAAHVHGPASPTETAKSIVTFPIPESPITGTATLTPNQETDLLAGRYYVDVHTSANPSGELRGQIIR
jgi:hypothetical protein